MKIALVFFCLFCLTYASPIYRQRRSSDSSDEQSSEESAEDSSSSQQQVNIKPNRIAARLEKISKPQIKVQLVQQNKIVPQIEKSKKPEVKVQPVQQSISQESEESAQLQANFKQVALVDKNEVVPVQQQPNKDDCIIVGVKPGKNCIGSSDSSDSSDSDESEDSDDSEDSESDESHEGTTPAPIDVTTPDEYTPPFTRGDNSGRGDSNLYLQKPVYFTSKSWELENSVEAKPMKSPKSKIIDKPLEKTDVVLKAKPLLNEAIEDDSSTPEVENQLDWTTESPQGDVVTTDSSSSSIAETSSQQNSNSTEEDSEADDQSQQTEEDGNSDDSTEEISNEEDEEDDENPVSNDTSNQQVTALKQAAAVDDSSSNQTTESYHDSTSSSNQDENDSQDMSPIK